MCYTSTATRAPSEHATPTLSKTYFGSVGYGACLLSISSTNLRCTVRTKKWDKAALFLWPMSMGDPSSPAAAKTHTHTHTHTCVRAHTSVIVSSPVPAFCVMTAEVPTATVRSPYSSTNWDLITYASRLKKGVLVHCRKHGCFCDNMKWRWRWLQNAGCVVHCAPRKCGIRQICRRVSHYERFDAFVLLHKDSTCLMHAQPVKLTRWSTRFET